MFALPKARIRWLLMTVMDEVAKVEQELAGRGRVLLRKSGTEPLIRVMVEGEHEQQVRDMAQRIAKQVESAF